MKLIHHLKEGESWQGFIIGWYSFPSVNCNRGADKSGWTIKLIIRIPKFWKSIKKIK